MAAVFVLAWTLASAQEPAQTTPPSNPTQTTIVHGVVRNGVSGLPLARALVRINGDAATAALTDGDGRFEIADVTEGPQEFTVTKPGYLDAIEAAADSGAWNSRGYGHNVIVAADMGDVVFTMQPVNSIIGQLQLSTGDQAAGIQVMLLKRTVQDGRAMWQIASTARSNSEGVYRFGELADGLYAVYTEPSMDNDGDAGLVEKGRGAQVARQGYAMTFYPDARDLNGAAKISLTGGNQVQANMTLTLEPFQTVTASVTQPGRRPNDQIAVQVKDAQGYQLPYAAQYDSESRTVQAALPDGSYGFVAEMMANRPMQIESGGERINFSVKSPAELSGQVTFAVADRAVSNLRLPMSAAGNTPVQVTVAHTTNGASQDTVPRLYIGLTPVGDWMSGNMTYGYAQSDGSAENRISDLSQNVHPPAGSYWVHTNVTPGLLCETSFTAGGVNLSREPLVINDSRAAPGPLVLALRDDCAKLTLALPRSLGVAAGMERFFTVYVVPDFDSTVDVVPQTLRLSTGGLATLTGLSPGSYHVYTFDHPVALEYRNAAVLRALPSQAVTLSQNAETQLRVEVAEP